MAQTPHRSPSAIAADIRRLFPKGGSAWVYVKPYVEAMEQLVSWRDVYIRESGEEIALRFLSNASAWRGPEAKAIKAEIKAAVGVKV